MNASINDIKILFEDKCMIACVKPCGLPSQPDLSGNPDLLSILNGKYHDVFLVHRLDTSTGGVMVYARGKQAAGFLSNEVQNHNLFKKTYLAVLEGVPEFNSSELTDYLFHDKRQNKSFVVSSTKKGAKEAKLSYELLATNNDGHSLVKIRLFTGRSHQIRVQFASRKTPIYGDGKYGGRCKIKGFALWSYKASIRHPITKKPIEVTALPDFDSIPWNEFEPISD